MITKISIVTPVYNEEQWLRRCIESVLGQTFIDWEMILVDDGSIDRSPGICDEYAAKDERIKVIHQANKGYSGARNAGIDTAEGKYLMFVDGDDWIEPGALQTAYIAMENHNVDLVIGGVNICIFKDDILTDKITGVPDEDFFFRIKDFHEAGPHLWKISGCHFYCCWDRIYRMSIINDYNLRFDENLYVQEDVKFIYSYYYHADRCMASNEVFYNYYRTYDKDDVGDKPQIDQYQCVEESLMVFIKMALKFNYPQEYLMQMYENTCEHFIKLSGKIFKPNAGLTPEEQFHKIVCMTDSFAFRFFCQEFSASDTFWKGMKKMLEAENYKSIYKAWKVKLDEGVVEACT